MNMKRFIVLILLLVILLYGCAQDIIIDQSSIVTRTGTVTDHAMASEGRGKIWDKSYPYISIEFEDSTGVCIWNKNDVDDSGIKTGDTVEVTYGIQENSDHYILIDIKDIS